MKWSLPLFVLTLAAGPGIYAVLSLLQPNKLHVMLVVLGLPVLWVIFRGVAALFRCLFRGLFW